jgi:phosphate uptake regulator/CBS domain-containing protein
MKLGNVIVSTPVAKAGTTVREVIRDCVEAGVRGIPFCDEDGRVQALCSLKNIAKETLVPEYMIEAADLLGDDFRILEDAQARVREVLDQPIEPFLLHTFVQVPSDTALMKAVAVIHKNRTDYALVVDDGAYKGLVTIFAIAKRMLEVLITPKHLDPDLLQEPDAALDATRREIQHMGERVREMLDKIMPALLAADRKVFADLGRIEDETDILQQHIVTYLGKLSGAKASSALTQEIIGLLEVTNDLEHIADIIEVDMVTLAERFIEEEVTLGVDARAAFLTLATLVCQAFDDALKAVIEKDVPLAEKVIALAPQVYGEAETATRNEAKRFVEQGPDQVFAYTRFVEIIQNLLHIFAYIKRFAGTSLPVGTTQRLDESSS